jgi:hypothetical protein
VLLVSKRWHRVFLSEPTLRRWVSIARHRGIGVQPAAQLALLQRVGSMVTSLSLLHLHGQEIQAVLESVRPDQLQQLIVVDIESQLAAALPRFSSLTTLSVSQSSIGIQAVGVAMALPHLLQLRRLYLCEESHAPTSLAAGIAACVQLTELRLFIDSYDQPGTMHQLTALHQLCSVWLEARSEHGLLEPPAPVLLPALTAFRYQAAVDETPGETPECMWLAVLCTAAATQLASLMRRCPRADPRPF